MGNFREKKKLGNILLDSGVVTSEQLEKALEEQKLNKGKKLGETLVDMGITSEVEIACALTQQLHTEFVTLSEYKIPDKVVNLISEREILDKYVVMPFSFHQDTPSILRVAMADPMDIVAIDDLSILTNYQIEPVIATPCDIKSAIDKYYGNAENKRIADSYAMEWEKRQYALEELEENNKLEVNRSPIVKLVRNMIEQAVRQRASDIHIEALERRVRIRYRVDGVLKEAAAYQSALLSAIIARIKILGGMDIAEKRKPQDGRITIEVDRKEFDIRVSILPTSYGEKAVMRLSETRMLNRNKAELGLTDSDLIKFNRLLQTPHGLLLVTGPTGSGKSTTLYTVLSELNQNEVNIITVEDPVEANIDGINQVQVNTKADLTFATALRAILRQDPDIIMIGEIRDSETAGIAVKASITGHLVVSTLHTNSAASSITRLVDMGIEPYLIGDATIGVIAQRLVRRLCGCKKGYYATKEEREYLRCDSEELQLYKPEGCIHCNGTGYLGRIGIYEIMPVTQKIRSIINRKGSSDEIHQAALSEGMSTLYVNARQQVLDGVTSLSEMRRIAIAEV
ncbi:Flp pilus assembly complex ATPase component TadA [Lachnospiraceae bacterium MD1]|jgi:type IV pilus assembly protein PilB|uniref:Flp pilus assembly complex ATPase component TadA n=1 Tax=Variimorphobacter saccharofermentans TaxID=2755051 RepID=A0A839K1A0_9FIRM|nr:type II/IV secretion system protein [Variimorphobacter saccharofermentans]MBB2183675.1 Flp pilus assembly complex ATPase component TadA [Variimorphobacter saccharofermentans]